MRESALSGADLPCSHGDLQAQSTSRYCLMPQ